MKRGKTTIFIGVGISLLALLMFPVLQNTWERHCLDIQVRCLGEIYRAITEKVMESKSLGHKACPPQTLSEIIDEKMKMKLKKSGIGWRQIQYYPLTDDAPDTNVILSLESDKHIITVRKGGTVFIDRGLKD